MQIDGQSGASHDRGARERHEESPGITEQDNR